MLKRLAGPAYQVLDAPGQEKQPLWCPFPTRLAPLCMPLRSGGCLADVLQVKRRRVTCPGAGYATPAGFTVPPRLIVPAMTEIRRVHLPVVRTLPASPFASCALSAACLNADAAAKTSRWKGVLVPRKIFSALYWPSCMLYLSGIVFECPHLFRF